jgi:hypothetical protein
MNTNYIGSIAERKMRFASSVEVVINEKNELFNAVSIYVPCLKLRQTSWTLILRGLLRINLP